MRWKLKERPDLTKWHLYFAWFPVGDDKEVIWLEWAERRRVYGYHDDYWEYRIPPKP